MRPALDEHAFSAIAMVSRVFAPLLDREDILFSLSKDSTGDSNQWHFVIRSGIEPRRKGTVALDFTLNESEGFNDRTLHLLAIRVDGIHNYAPQELDALSWDDLDGLAILPYVPDLTIVLPWKPELMSQEDVVRISGSVRLCLAQLSLLSKLRFPQIYPNIRVVPAKQASRDNDVPGQELSLPIQQELCRS
ncbi:hypothetical protein NM688_g6814 [Phlebia brevispora]|uniref:Uncharacterized protein n=1 Tax=Phlebia brevispora TaxID=194682 RepID=A0ACC1SC95_9APHY|nr:hypothetical protein NM688_g6814 [Phlebia brevispora]